MEPCKESCSRSAPPPSQPLRWTAWIGLAALTLVTTWPGFQQGLGRLPEEVTRIAISSQITSSGDLNPHWFGHPATLLIYLLAGLFKLFSWATGTDIRELYLSDPSTLFLTGRLVARVAAAACTVLSFEIARWLLPVRWALISAILLAINPLFTMHAHRARADHLLTMALLLGTVLLLGVQTKPSPKRAAVLAGFSGLALTFKYSAASLMISWLISLWARCGTQWRTLGIGLRMLGLAACAAFLASPYLLLSWHEAWGGLGSEIIKDSSWEPHENVFFMLRVLGSSFSIPGVIILAIACGRGLSHCWKSGPKGMISILANRSGNPLAALSLVYIVYLMGTFMASTYNPTWLAPITPFLSIILSLELCHAEALISRRWQPLVGRLATAALILIIASQQLHQLQSISAMRQLTGTTKAAETWLKHNIRPGDSVLFLQPADAREPAHFPRVEVAHANLFISDPSGVITQICRGEQGSHYSTTQSLLNEPCYPRPIFRSESKRSIEDLMKEFDAVIYADRRRLPSPDQASLPASLQLRSFTPPAREGLPEYSRNPFPQGDAGVWTSIQIITRARPS